MTKARK